MRVFDLEQPRFEGMPIHDAHRPGYSYLLHRHHEDEYRHEEAGTRTSAAGILVCMEHSGTHIDAICHQADDLKLYGDIPVNREVQTPRGFTKLGIEEIPPIVAPGVLLDVAAIHETEVLEPGYAVTAEDLISCCERQGVGGGSRRRGTRADRERSLLERPRPLSGRSGYGDRGFEVARAERSFDRGRGQHGVGRYRV